MGFDFYFAVLLFCFSTTISPGPNNIMIMASGLNHGVKSSLPHYFGITLGFSLMVGVIGFGLGAVFIRYPFLHLVIKIFGISYLLFLAWKIASTRTANAGGELKKPFTFFQSAAFQWVNPKAWVMAVGVIATFTSGGNVKGQVIAIVAAYFIACTCCTGSWLLLGASLQRVMENEKHLIIFNRCMALLLVASVVSMAFSE